MTGSVTAKSAVGASPGETQELPDGTLVYQPAEAFYSLEVDSDLTGEDLFAAYGLTPAAVAERIKKTLER